jgi:nucleoside-diphosphate-sugar epimerase
MLPGRIAVTGGSGFCGAVVARTAAAAGATVICLGRRPGPVGEFRFWDAARTRPDLTGADVVLHLAAAVGDPPPGRASEAAFRAVNVDGTARLLEAAGGRPVVWVSSASVYAPAGPNPISEDHPLGGMTAYGRTKAAGEQLALGAGAVVLRPRAVYGPGDPHLLPRLRRVVRGGRALLPGPDVPLSLTAVENLADACLAAVGLPAGDPVEGDPSAGGSAEGVLPARSTPEGYRPARSPAEGNPPARATAEGNRPARSPAEGNPPAGAVKGWPAGVYNIADAITYRRDAVVGSVCRVPVTHLPIPLVSAAAAVVTAVARLTGRPPVLSRYAVEQLAHPVVLDISRARAQGWTPRRSFADFLNGMPAP